MTMQGRKHGADAGTEELRQEVDRARHDLGETVEQLAAKADVKAIARQKAADARLRMRETASSARDVGAWAKTVGETDTARRAGIVAASAGALAMTALLMRWNRARRPQPRMRSMTRARFSPNARMSPKALMSPRARLSPRARVSPMARMSPMARLSPRATLSPRARMSPRATLSPMARFSPGAVMSPRARFSPGARFRPMAGARRGRGAPVRIVFRTGQRRPVRIGRGGSL